MTIQWPKKSDRLVIVGRTGSGKTQNAAWHLSQWDFNRFPWVMVNTKDDALLNEIARFPSVHNIGLNETPKENGLYAIRPMPDEGDELNEFLLRIWQRKNCGIYIDEGYMIEEDMAFNRLLTQGRSRNIPMIILSQRPVWISKFTFSEASFIQIFDLGMEDDRKTIARHVRGYNVDHVLPEFHSLWYDMGKATITPLGPVPDRTKILDTFRQQLTPPPTQMVAPEQPKRRFI